MSDTPVVRVILIIENSPSSSQSGYFSALRAVLALAVANSLLPAARRDRWRNVGARPDFISYNAVLAWKFSVAFNPMSWCQFLSSIFGQDVLLTCDCGMLDRIAERDSSFLCRLYSGQTWRCCAVFISSGARWMPLRYKLPVKHDGMIDEEINSRLTVHGHCNWPL